MSNIQTIGVDLAKNVFSIHGVDAYGKCTLRKTVKRNKLLDTFANLPPVSLVWKHALVHTIGQESYVSSDITLK